MTARILAVVLLLGLPKVEARPADAPPTRPDARAALTAAEPGPWRAAVADTGVYELVPGRRTFNPGPVDPFDVVVVAVDADVVWVTDDYADVRILIGVPPARLAPRLTARTLLAATAADVAAGRAGTVTFAPGTAATVVETVGSAVRLRWSDETITAEGWAAADGLAPVWRREPLHPGEGGLVRVDTTQPLAIHATPDGPVYATLAGPSASLRRTGPAQGPWLPVEVATRDVWATGWVLASRVREEVYLWTRGRGGGDWAVSDVSVMQVAAGTWFYREGGEAPIARALADTRVIRVTEGDPVQVSLPSRWGWIAAELR